jgi:hypothetical protein
MTHRMPGAARVSPIRARSEAAAPKERSALDATPDVRLTLLGGGFTASIDGEPVPERA